jgi:5S rRNA maturation endonuclease (ribonuclease M5)
MGPRNDETPTKAGNLNSGYVIKRDEMDVSESAYQRLIHALDTHGSKIQRQSDSEAQAQCPAHTDKQPSLSLTEIDGMVLVYCHAGCDNQAVTAALGLTMADLFDNPRGATYVYPDGRQVHRTPRKKFSQRGNTKGNSLFGSDQLGDAETVYVVEGEKDVLAVRHVGGCAVSPPQGASTDAGRWDWTKLRGRHVKVVADKDNAGRKHAEAVAAQVQSIAASVEIVGSAVGKDASDHIAAGRTLADLRPPSLLDALGFTSDWLNDQEFPELEYVVPSLICEGLGLLVAPPKKGKSFLVGNLAVAVAAGSKALGCIPVKKRPVLVLALEDGGRRIQERYTRINNDQPIPSGITFITKATPAECMSVIREYLDRHGDDRPLIILDTLGKVKPPKRSGEESFQVDYSLGSQFKELADSVPGATILIIHHTRKADAADFIDLVSGTQGLAGSVDYVLALDRKRHSDEAILSVTGRDIVEAEYALIAEAGILWRLDGTTLASASARADERRDEATESARLNKLGRRAQDIVRLIETRGHLTPAEVALKFHMTPTVASNQLNRLADADLIVKTGRGEYQSKRYHASRGSDGFDRNDETDDNNPSFPSESSLSLHTSPSSDRERAGNTCLCGGKLVRPKSVERGICAECWSDGRRDRDE